MIHAKPGAIAGIDKEVSRLVLGSYAFGELESATVDRLLDRFVAAGGNCIDTAWSYCKGASELALGRWLRERRGRDRLVLVGKGAGQGRTTPEAIASDLRTSLDRLGVDRFDLWMLHRDNPSVPVGEFVACLNEHLDAGWTDAIGASNWTPERLDQALEYAARHGLRRFSASSPNLTLATWNRPPWPGCVTASDDASLIWYEQRQLPLLAWSSQGHGFFAFDHDNGDRLPDGDADVWPSPVNLARWRRSRWLGVERAAAPIQVALAWVLHQPFPTHAIIGPRSEDELVSSLAGADLRLTAAEVAWLRDGGEPPSGGVARRPAHDLDEGPDARH